MVQGILARSRALLKLSSPRPFAFIHINKCGGTSVEKALGLQTVHETALECRGRIGAEAWERLRTFSIVRHPYAKVASHYRYRLKTGVTGLSDGHIGLSDWVRAAYRDRDPAYYNKPLMFAPCLDWLTDENGRIMVDYVGKLETIGADWRVIQDMIGTRAALPWKNATQPEQDPGAMMDDGARQILQERFAADFEAFGYEP